MKTTIVIIAAFLIFFSCTKNNNASLVGKWNLTEELLDPGNGEGVFQKVDYEQTIEFFKNGTFSSTGNLCQMSPDNGETKTGVYSTAENKIIPNNCEQDGRSITFELSNQELIISFPCIEPCKQKYERIN